MKGLFLVLPPFSPDYSGVCSALLEMGALLVVHDGTGCAGNYLCHDELRAQAFSHMLYTSNLRELDVVMGSDEALLEKVERAAADLDPRMIVLLNTPAPMVIGTDFRALSRILEKRTGKPTLYFDTTGMRFYDWGIQRALLALVELFSGGKKAAGGVTVLGASPLNIGRSENARRLQKIVAEASGLPAEVLGMNSAPDALARLGASRLNVLVSTAAIPAAQWCQARYGTPWIMAYPVGQSGVRALTSQIRTALGSAVPEPAKTDARPARGRRALVIHEQAAANGFRACLRQEFGYADADVASFFSMEPAFAEKEDFALGEEDAFIDAVKRGGYDDVFCDHLLHSALSGTSARLIDLPHLAVSGVLCYPEAFPAFGPAAADWLRSALQ